MAETTKDVDAGYRRDDERASGRGSPFRRLPESTSRDAFVVAGCSLACVYLATAATTLTFWDAGEFLAAFHSFGIPHPPGTALFVLLGRVAVLARGLLGVVLPGSLVSVIATAAAGGVTASLVARWTASRAAGIAAALCAGTMSSVWLNATETEVYAASLCLAMVMLWTADRVARDAMRRDAWTMLLAYLFGLGVALHASVLVAAPAAVLLAASDGARVDARRLVMLGGLGVAAMGMSLVSPLIVSSGVVAALGSAALRGHRARSEAPARDSLGDSRSLAAPAMTVRALCVLLLGASSIVVLLVRSRLGAPLDQGHPDTWRALADVIARKQYAVAPPWPRLAPWWLQLANVGEWADWQVAVGLDGAVGASALRTPLTILYGLLGVVGASSLRRTNRAAWRTTLVLFLCGSVGVVGILNMRAGPSFGWGVLPANAIHEARERDYFFVLAFWTWGVWAALGALALGTRVSASRAGRAVGLALAAAPVAMNWSAVTRRRWPESALPEAFARGILESAPPRAVVLLVGDNDTYPVWFVQHAERTRRDVVPVTIPLLGAPWYRAELARLHALLPAGAEQRWEGDTATVAAIVSAATRDDRPLATSVAVPYAMRAALGGTWTLRGLVWVRTAAGPARWLVDSVATAREAQRIDPRLFAPARADGDGVAQWAQALLRCPSQARSASLEGACK